MFRKNLLIFMVGLVMLTFGAAIAIGQQRCEAFGGTIYAWRTPAGFVGVGDFNIGNRTLHANVLDAPISSEPHPPEWAWGTELATFDFGEGNTVELLTEYTAEHLSNPAKVFHINEIGTIGNGTGRFAKAYGHFSSQGVFGAGVVLPAGKVTPPPDAKAFWIGMYNGSICGLSETSELNQ